MKLLAKYIISAAFIILAIVLGFFVLTKKIPGYWIYLSIVLIGINKTILWSEMSLFAKKSEEKSEEDM